MFIIAVSIVLVLLCVPPGFTENLNGGAGESSLTGMERQFCQAANERGTSAAFLEFLAEDGIIFRPGPISGKKWYQEHPDTTAVLNWKPVFADISRSDDLGYTIGPWEYQKDKDSEPILFGHYVTLWQKQADKSWKVVVDGGIVHTKPNIELQVNRSQSTQENTRSQGAPPPTGSDELLKIEHDFSKVASSQDLKAAFQQFGAAEICLFRSDAFPASGLKAVVDIFLEKNSQASWQPQKTVVSAAGDLGFTYGTVDYWKAADRQKTLQQGSYLRIWRKEAQGSWRIVLDLDNLYPREDKAAE